MSFLNVDFSVDQIESLFEPFGTVLKVEKFGNSAVVEFENENDCAEAVQNMDGYEFSGIFLQVTLKKE